MRQYWYKKILIMIVVFTIAIGGSSYLIEARESSLNQEVNASTTDKQLVIPGGMPIGIYLETDGVMVLGTDEIQSVDGNICEPAKHLVKAGDYIKKIDDKTVNTKAELVEAVSKLTHHNVILQLERNGELIKIKLNAVEAKMGQR